MRTTIDIPDKLFRRLKAIVALKGISMKKFITEALKRELEYIESPNKQKRLSFPVVPSKKPGSVKLTSEKLYSILNNEDIDVSS